MFRAPGSTPNKVLEIVTPEWQYYDNDEYNFDEGRVVPVKEQRRMGTQRGNKTTPQAPAIEVRAKGLPDGPVACRCRLWNFGSCLEREPPRHDGTASQLTMLRANVMIEVTENLAMFGPVEEDGFRHARLRCFITRGARVQCKKFHIAFYIDCVNIAPNTPVPGPDDSSFAIADVVQGFPWARSARMSISEKAMCPRMHDKTKKAKAKSSKISLDSSSSTSDQSPVQSSPKRLKRAMDATMQRTQNLTPLASTTNNMIGSGKKSSPSPLKKKEPTPQMVPGMPMQNGQVLMPPQLAGLGAPPNGLYNPVLDRQLRLSRISFPSFEEDMLQHSAIPDEGELASMESALGHGRRSSQFIGGAGGYWYPPYAYMGQNPAIPSQSGNQQPPVGMNGGMQPNGISGSSPLPGPNHSPTTFGPIHPHFSMDFSGELSHRRLSTSGHWSAEMQTRRMSAAELARLSSSPLPTHQPGRGPEWEALFEAHTKVVSLDKSSPDYLTKKTAAWAEVFRAAEMIEQRLQKR